MDKISFDFKGRTAIVTGGAQGFGLDITKRFLRSGSLNLKGIFDTCSRFGVLSLFCCPAALINATCC